MADQKISALTEVTAPAVSDMMPIVNAATTKKVQIQNLVKLGNVAIGARVYHNATQSISDATDTAIIFNSERFDTDAIHDTATNNSRLTCKTAGVYMILANIGFASNATGRREIFIRLNATTQIGNVLVNAVSTSATHIVVSTVYLLAVNDFVEVMVNQTSGGALNTVQAGNVMPEFTMIRMGA